MKDSATKAFVKIAEQRLSDYLRGLKVKSHNQQMKAARLRDEADAVERSQNEIEQQIQRIESGDWSAVEHFQLQETEEKKKE